MSNDKINSLDKSYSEFSKTLNTLDLSERLLIISNLLFEKAQYHKKLIVLGIKRFFNWFCWKAYQFILFIDLGIINSEILFQKKLDIQIVDSERINALLLYINIQLITSTF